MPNIIDFEEKKIDMEADAMFRVITGQAKNGDLEKAKKAAKKMEIAANILNMQADKLEGCDF